MNNTRLMTKLLWMLLCVGFIASASAFPKDRLIDSLKGAYAAEGDARRRVDILLNLKDLTDSSEDEMFYARKLFDEAFAAGDAFAVGSSLGSLASYYIARPESADSLGKLLRAVEPLLEGSSMEGLPAYYRMVDMARRIQVAGTEESVRLCQDYVDSVRTSPPHTVCDEASQLFLKGIAAYKLGSAEGRMHMERGLPYWTDEAALLPKMRPTARRNFHANLITCLISVYGTTRDRDALVRTADDYLAMLDAYYLDPEVVRRRPYIPKEMSYLVCYYTMCTSPLIDRQRAGAYYDRYRPFRGELLVAGQHAAGPTLVLQYQRFLLRTLGRLRQCDGLQRFADPGFAPRRHVGAAGGHVCPAGESLRTHGALQGGRRRV